MKHVKTRELQKDTHLSIQQSQEKNKTESHPDWKFPINMHFRCFYDMKKNIKESDIKESK